MNKAYTLKLIQMDTPKNPPEVLKLLLLKELPSQWRNDQLNLDARRRKAPALAGETSRVDPVYLRKLLDPHIRVAHKLVY